MIKKTLGGDRVGSGDRMQAELHNYERSTHDLGNIFKTTMAPGVLIPFYKKLCQNGDTWSINLKTLVRTMPAIGPLFGTYKLQMDVYEIPIRLYNGILHNNMTKIGMDMSKVKLPKIELYANITQEEVNSTYERQISPSALMAYLGLRGISGINYGDKPTTIIREFNAVPVLAYYDIFKNYYANKQEENAYVITNKLTNERKTATKEVTYIGWQNHSSDEWPMPFYNEYQDINNVTYLQVQRDLQVADPLINYYTVHAIDGKKLEFDFDGKIETQTNAIEMVFYDETNQTYLNLHETEGWNAAYNVLYPNKITIKFRELIQYMVQNFPNADLLHTVFRYAQFVPGTNYDNEIQLKSFPLDNIDNMRISILSNTALNTRYLINNIDSYPYKANYEKLDDNNSACRYTMAGLVTKTYQSDIFNNWLSSEWIDGIKGINAMSAVAVQNGHFTIDALNLAHKVYNMLNRIAVSGGTYEDWQEAVYGEDALRRAESPIYCGGMSGIIAFEEVVSTADTQTAAAGDQPLGSLAGKGTVIDTQGGNIDIHIKEPSYIMGIVSITPIIDYCQGNDFDMTEIDSLNDLHKPELDQIGFQDLLLERAAWWGTVWDENNKKFVKHAGGKLPAWIEYMTSINQVYGDFAEKEKLGFMCLTRDYEHGNKIAGFSKLDPNSINPTIPVKDWTTYINPTKYNYQFANTALDAQNFWVQIGIDAEARRKMSAKIIPNL